QGTARADDVDRLTFLAQQLDGRDPEWPVPVIGDGWLRRAATVVMNRGHRVAGEDDTALLEHNGLRTQVQDGGKIVRHEDNRHTSCHHVLHLPYTFFLERRVAHAQNL